jgi:peptidoglycan-N-acetylglucosamine deacetylase
MRIVKLAFRCVLLLFLYVVPSVSQQVAFTFDDLPSHGDLPPGQTRLAIAQSILRSLHDQHMPAVYGFINAAKMEKNPDEMAVLKAWRAAGNPLGSHTYSHASLNELTPAQFEVDSQKRVSPLEFDGRPGLALVPLSLPLGGRHSG